MTLTEHNHEINERKKDRCAECGGLMLATDYCTDYEEPCIQQCVNTGNGCTHLEERMICGKCGHTTEVE